MICPKRLKLIIVLSLPPTQFSLPLLHSSLSPAYTALQSTTCFQSSPSQLQLSCRSCGIHQRQTKPPLWRNTIQFPRRQATNTMHSKSLESPSVRMVRKMHLRNGPQTDKACTVRDRDVSAEDHVSRLVREMPWREEFSYLQSVSRALVFNHQNTSESTYTLEHVHVSDHTP